jgi:hypothetical protein
MNVHLQTPEGTYEVEWSVGAIPARGDYLFLSSTAYDGLWRVARVVWHVVGNPMVPVVSLILEDATGT